MDQKKLDSAIEKAEKLSKKFDSVLRRADADFKESDHPRSSDGKFGSGGGSTRPGVKHGEWEPPKQHKDGGKTHRFPIQLRNGKTGYHQVHELPEGGAMMEKSGGYARKFPSLAEAKRYIEETK